MKRSYSWIPGLVFGLALATSAAAQTTAPRPANNDDTVEERIEYIIATDDDVAKYNIDVDVTGGAVVLSGSVATAAQKAEAERLAKVNGITKITNNISVDPDADRTLADRAKAGMSRSGEAITDAWITTKVKWFLTADDDIDAGSINVDTENKVVTLKGTVPTAAAKAEAVALAKRTDGVQNVVDQLSISPSK